MLLASYFFRKLKIILNCIKKYYRVDRKEISFLRFIFEAYDGIALLSTVDANAGVVVFYIPPGYQRDVESVMGDLKKRILIQSIEPTDEN